MSAFLARRSRCMICPCFGFASKNTTLYRCICGHHLNEHKTSPLPPAQGLPPVLPSVQPPAVLDLSSGNPQPTRAAAMQAHQHTHSMGATYREGREMAANRPSARVRTRDRIEFSPCPGGMDLALSMIYHFMVFIWPWKLEDVSQEFSILSKNNFIPLVPDQATRFTVMAQQFSRASLVFEVTFQGNPSQIAAAINGAFVAHCRDNNLYYSRSPTLSQPGSSTMHRNAEYANYAWGLLEPSNKATRGASRFLRYNRQLADSFIPSFLLSPNFRAVKNPFPGKEHYQPLFIAPRYSSIRGPISVFDPNEPHQAIHLCLPFRVLDWNNLGDKPIFKDKNKGSPSCISGYLENLSCVLPPNLYETPVKADSSTFHLKNLRRTRSEASFSVTGDSPPAQRRRIEEQDSQGGSTGPQASDVDAANE